MYNNNTRINLINECERKFVHQYVLKTMPDYVDEKKAFFYGSLLHKMLEKYDAKISSESLFDFSLNALAQEYPETIKELEDNEKELQLLEAKMQYHIDDYKAFLAANPEMKIISRELTVKTSNIWSVLDLIVVIGNKWYIFDYKTASSFSYLTPLMLAKNNQLLTYASLASVVVEQLPALKNYTFGGVGFIEFLKTTLTWCKKTTCAEDYIKKVREKGKTFRLLLVEVDKLDFETFRYEFNKYYSRMIYLETEAGKAAFFGTQNRNACSGQYGSRCEFFSQCFDKNQKAIVFDESTNINNILELPF